MGGKAGAEQLPLGMSTVWLQSSWALDAMAPSWSLQNSRALDIAVVLEEVHGERGCTRTLRHLDIAQQMDPENKECKRNPVTAAVWPAMGHVHRHMRDIWGLSETTG